MKVNKEIAALRLEIEHRALEQARNKITSIRPESHAEALVLLQVANAAALATGDAHEDK